MPSDAENIQEIKDSILYDRREQNAKMDILISKTIELTVAVQTSVERDKMYERRIEHVENSVSTLTTQINDVKETLATVKERTKTNSESRVMITRVVLGVFASLVTLSIIGGLVFIKIQG